MNNSDIFKRAWQIASQGAWDFGGEKSEYFDESLRIASVEAKTHCSVITCNWNYDNVDGFVQLITPQGQIIIITRYTARTRRTQCRELFEAAKHRTYFFTSGQIDTLANISKSKF